MSALRIIGVLLLIVLAIGYLRVGALVSFGDGLRVRLRVGPLRLTVYPRKKRRKKPKKPKEDKPEQPKEEKPPKPKKKRAIPRPTLGELLDLADTALAALRATVRRACRRTRIDPLELTAVLGGGDPAEAAMRFGAANTLMYTVMPRAEETFEIPDPSLHLRLDYDRVSPAASGTIGVSLRVGDLFAIAFTLILPLGKWFLRFKRAHCHKKATRSPAEQPDMTAAERQSA